MSRPRGKAHNYEVMHSNLRFEWLGWYPSSRQWGPSALGCAWVRKFKTKRAMLRCLNQLDPIQFSAFRMYDLKDYTPAAWHRWYHKQELARWHKRALQDGTAHDYEER